MVRLAFSVDAVDYQASSSNDSLQRRPDSVVAEVEVVEADVLAVHPEFLQLQFRVLCCSTCQGVEEGRAYRCY